MGEPEDLLQLVIHKVNRGDAPDSKFPDSRGEYWPLCPFHPDRHHGSFAISERGYRCFSCGVSGSLRKLANHLGCEVAGLQVDSGGTSPPSPSLTVEEYAAHKHLPVKFLKEQGLSTIYFTGHPVVKMSYIDAEEVEVSARFRLSLDGNNNRFRWRKGSRAMPYGLWKLDEAKGEGYVILVEGESDAQTLWYYGFPALGIPGASTWKSEWAPYVEGRDVYVWQEPDSGGSEFVKNIGETLPDALVLAPPGGRKDISECHILGDDVPSLLRKLMAEAVPFRNIRAQALAKQATEARAQAKDLLDSHDILAEFEKLCKELGLAGEKRNAKVLYLALTSRLLERPVSLVVKGPSSGGKSFVVETVLKAFPASAFYTLTSLSERALVYSDESLQHRILVVYEASGLSGELQSYLMRTLLSEGHLRYETVVKTSDGPSGKLIEREGPTGLIITTTRIHLHPENETRMLSLNVRDDAEQTSRILQALADQANEGGLQEPDLTTWYSLQTYLELAGERRVVVPYARRLAELDYPGLLRLRRDFGAVLNLIRSHAILHQEHRERDKGRVVASLEDYRAVYSLVSDLINEGVHASVKRTVRETVETIRELSRDKRSAPVTYTQVADHLGLDKSAVHRRVREAIEAGYVVNLEHRRGRPATLELGDPMPVEVSVLPEPDALEGGGGGILSGYAATLQLGEARGEGEAVFPDYDATVQPSEWGSLPREQPLCEHQIPAQPPPWVGKRVKIEDLADFREGWGLQAAGSLWPKSASCPVVYFTEAHRSEDWQETDLFDSSGWQQEL